MRIRLVKDYYKFSKSDLETLKYCVDCELLDLGHNGLRNIDFAAHMPKLRVAILAIGYVDDISPLAGCTEMEYLELFTNRIADITPLTGMTKLKHLNLTWNRVEDVSPLFSMTGLERLWIGRNLFSEEQQTQLAAALPDTEIKYSHGRPAKAGETIRAMTGCGRSSTTIIRKPAGIDTTDQREGNAMESQQPISQPPQQNGKAVASLVLGILATVFLFFSGNLLLGVTAIVLAVVGVALGAQARRELPQGSAGMATAGMVLSIVVLALGVLFTVSCTACAALLVAVL